MKRIFAFLIALLLSISVAFAEIPDVSNLTKEELAELKKIIDTELLPIIPNGKYVVGVDIKPGTYVFYNIGIEGGYGGGLTISELVNDEWTFLEDEYIGSGQNCCITLKENQRLKIENFYGYVEPGDNLWWQP